eukprot:TRINITY_DN15169_c0_g1_i7.p1 TRINITY_DN15169_c0_g1~~TRINITY_DN15169_c0_g1_i7.p1  ORF type:complete len:925 (+),score=119.71 TRINITY_DN15169_c0_g1_i7:61-2835(+)
MASSQEQPEWNPVWGSCCSEVAVHGTAEPEYVLEDMMQKIGDLEKKVSELGSLADKVQHLQNVMDIVVKARPETIENLEMMMPEEELPVLPEKVLIEDPLQLNAGTPCSSEANLGAMGLGAPRSPTRPSRTMEGRTAMMSMAETVGAANGTTTATKTTRETEVVQNTWMAKAVRVQSESLDGADSYHLECSLWDAAVFVGLDCVGFGTSMAMVVCLFMSIALQVFFIWIVHQHMIEDIVDPRVLDDLLLYRASVGHDVQYADKIGMRSMIQMVCSEVGWFHLSGSQSRLQTTISRFSRGGHALSLVALLCWIVVIFRDINDSTMIARAILHSRTSKTTLVLSGALQELMQAGFAEYEAGSLSRADVRTRFLAMSNVRKTMVVMFLVIPKLVVAILLGVVGARFLGVTSNMTDLLLNAMALTFVLDIDDILFFLLAPRRVQSLVRNLEPLPTGKSPMQTLTGLPWLGCMLKLMLVGTLLFVIDLQLLQPVFGRIAQAKDILCSGNTDFVYSTHPLTGTIIVTRTADDSATSWSTKALSVLQVASPRIEVAYGWEPTEKQLSASRSTPEETSRLPPGGSWHAELDPSMFDYIMQLSSKSAEQLSAERTCNDLSNTDALHSQLVMATRNESFPYISSCSETKDLCALPSMSVVRFLCPMTCECGTFPSPKSGLFGSPKFGCPNQCGMRAAALQSMRASTGTAPPCLDAGSEYFSGQRSICYYLAPGAWLVPFLAHAIGNASVGDEIDGATLDLVLAAFHKSDISFDIAGLVVQDIISLAPCPGPGAGELATGRGMSSNGRKLIYSALAGLRDESRSTLHTRVAALFAFSGDREVNASRTEEAVNSLVDGTLINELQAGNWNIVGGSAHPRGLTDCAFLTSFEIVFVWNIDVCDTKYNSLRSICPVSCGCQTLPSVQCPPTCAKGANS